MSFPTGQHRIRKGIVLCRNAQETAKLPNIGRNRGVEPCTLYVGRSHVPEKSEKFWDFRVRPRRNLNLPVIDVSSDLDKSSRERLSHKDSGFSEESDEDLNEERLNDEETLQIRGTRTKISPEKQEVPISPKKAKSLILMEENTNSEKNDLMCTRSLSCYGPISSSTDEKPVLYIKKLQTRFGNKPVSETPSKLVVRKPYKVPLTGVCTPASGSLRFEILGLKTPRGPEADKTLLFYPVRTAEDPAKLPEITKDATITLLKNKRKYMPTPRVPRKEMATNRITIPTGDAAGASSLVVMSRATTTQTPQRVAPPSRIEKEASVYSEDEVDEEGDNHTTAKPWTQNAQKPALPERAFDIKETQDNSPIYRSHEQQIPLAEQLQRPKSPELEETSKKEIFDKCQQWLDRLQVEQGGRLSRVDEQE